jgi:hypothetical protein
MAKIVEGFTPGEYAADRLREGMHVKGLPYRPEGERWIVQGVKTTFYSGGGRVEVELSLREPFPAGEPARRRAWIDPARVGTVEVTGPAQILASA